MLDYKKMQCNSPVSIRSEGRRSGTFDIKSRHEIIIKNGVKRLSVPCGKCYPCLQNRRNEWTFRLEQEMKVSTSAWFLTLTYEDNNLPLYNIKTEKITTFGQLSRMVKEIEELDFNYRGTLVKKDYQQFMKKLRWHTDKWYKEIGDLAEIHGLKKRPVKYYAVGEYGAKTERPHYHAIIFNVPISIIKKLDNIWEKGFVKAGDVNTASIHYVTKYVINPDHKRVNQQNEFALISRGIGYSYIEANKKWHRENENYYVINKSGGKQKMPRYYKDKTFSKHQQKVEGHSNMLIGDKNFKEEYNKAIKQGDNYDEKVKQRTKAQLERLEKIRNKKQPL